LAVPESILSIVSYYLKRSLKADLAEAAASRDFFSPGVASLKRGLRENQSQKLALSGSEGFSVWLSAQLPGI